MKHKLQMFHFLREFWQEFVVVEFIND